MATRLKNTPMTAVPPMEQQLLDNIIAAYGGQLACLCPEEEQPNDGSNTVNIYLLELNENQELVPVNALYRLPADCLVED